MARLATRVAVSSILKSDPSNVWLGISDLNGVNYEMSPWLHMTSPDGVRLEDAANGEVLPLKLKGRGGFPLGTYRLGLETIVEGQGFLEQTRMLPFLLWQHERRIEAVGDGDTRIIDSLGWKWRATFLDRMFAAGVRKFFNHRHRKLKAWYGSA